MATLSIPIAGLRVGGAVKKGKVTPLGQSDHADIEKRIVSDVFVGEDRVEVRAEAKKGRARLVVSIAKGTEEVGIPIELSHTDGRIVVRGECTLSLAKLGLRAVKGPLGAFRLSDRVGVRFEAIFSLS